MVAKANKSACKLIRSTDQLRDWRAGLAPQARLGFVPTMGCLHAGHESLIASAREKCELVCVSIFVNPTQFGPNEDFDEYPRDLDGDLAICESHGVEVVFAPETDEMYGDLSRTTLVCPPETLVDRLCGASRPGHFQGVATIVTKLLNLVRPDCAFFGEKDFQQLTIIKRLVADLVIPTEIVAVPIIREPDGLALSSRNKYLSKEARQVASQLNAGLRKLEQGVRSGKALTPEMISTVRQFLTSLGFQVDYLEGRDINTLQPADKVPLVILVAARLAGVRLIDNVIVR